MKLTHALVFATPINPDPNGGGHWTPTQDSNPRWLFELLASALSAAGFKTLPAARGRPGVDAVPILGTGRRFKYEVIYLNPIVICEVAETRTFGEWLSRAPRDPQFARAFEVIHQAVCADARVRETLTFTGSKKDADAFVRASMEKLERALGIFSD